MKSFSIYIIRNSNNQPCLLENARWDVRPEMRTLPGGLKMNTGNVEIDIYGATVGEKCFLNDGSKHISVTLQRINDTDRFDGIIYSKGNGNFSFKGQKIN